MNCVVYPVRSRRVLDVLNGVEAGGGSSSGYVLQVGSEQWQELLSLVALQQTNKKLTQDHSDNVNLKLQMSKI